LWLIQESEPEELHAAQKGSASDLALLEAYALAHSDAEPQLLAEVTAATAEAFPQARHMVSGPLQGRLLKALAALKGAKRVLEVSADMPAVL
jgi:predicted O-methyltransferase YrrM